MDHREEQARLRDEELRADLAIRNEERRLAREEREMERELKDFDDGEERVEVEIEEEWRRERWGQEPEHPTAWPNRERKNRRDDTRGQNP